MPFSLSHIQFMRRLSIQPEENGTDTEDESPEVQSEKGNANNSGMLNDPNDLPLIPCLAHGPVGTSENSHEDASEDLRKISSSSFISIKSTSSLSSTCSAPGMISSSVGRPNGFSSAMSSQSEEAFDLKPMTKRLMTSRPSFISLCSIVSETSEVPQRLLPAPLQVELDLMQRSGIEGDEPKCRSHLPVLRCSSDYDISEMDVETDQSGHLVPKNCKKGLVKGIKHRMRKMSTEKNRFDIYSLSDETREQLKSLYVY